MNPYDAVRYPTHAKPQTHPDHLATLATLFGLQPAPARHCRVLEIGCGTGGNLIPMALGLPDSEFIGIDLAAEPIQEGLGIVHALGLGNIRLQAMDLMDVTAELGQFDYIIAFGMFSWVPAEAREKMLAICARQLAPQGVAFINYNAYPGYHLRGMLREMMLYHVAGIGDAEEAIGQAYWLLQFLAESQAGQDDLAYLRNELDKARQHPPGGLFHDDLAPGTTAFYFHEFADMAQHHGLQYLAEAEYFTMQEHLYGDRVAGVLERFSGDIIRKEQYLDFIRCRRFRQTLLCHAGLPIDREARPERMRGLRFSCPARPDAEGRYRRATGAPVKPVHPLACAALARLSESWPQRPSFDELLSACGEESDAAILSEILLGCYSAGLIEAHLDAPPFVMEPGERPVASPLARLQLQEDSIAVNLCHNLVQIAEEPGRRLVRMLDGNRGRTALAAEAGVTEEDLAQQLAAMGRMALLLA